MGVSAAWLGDADGLVNYGDENGRAAGRVVGHVLAWRAAFGRRPRRLQLLLAVEIELDDAVVRGRTTVGGRHDQRLLEAAQVRHALTSGMWTSSKCRSNAAGSSGWPYRTVILIMVIGKPIPICAPAELPRTGNPFLQGLRRGPRRDEERVVDARVGRGIGEVEELELVHGHSRPDARGEDVDALGRPLAADDLPAEQATVRRDDELDPDRTAARVVAGARAVLDQRRADLDAGLGRLALGDAGARHLVAADLRGGGADHARKGEVGARGVGAGDAS